MQKKLLFALVSILVLAVMFAGEYLLVRNYVCEDCAESEEDTQEESVPEAMMVLIEFKQMDGLINMVNDMNSRGIKGLLMVTPEFVEANKLEMKQVLSVGNVEVIPTYVEKPFWGISYEEQKSIISDMVERIETALDVDARIISSRYMASDENTVKVADELGIEYVTARGTTELATTVYKPEEYDVKIISISNIDTPEFKYGSLCDYSYYERAGAPGDMIRDLERATEEEKFVGVSHTYIGGYKKRWNDMWHEFWDSNEISWVSLDELAEVDKNMPMWQIPINKNAPYTPEKIRPVIPYEEEENVNNPCSVEEL